MSSSNATAGRKSLLVRVRSYELVVGDHLIEAGNLHPQSQSLAVSPVDLVLEQQLQELQGE
jgi:hypothetical protein